MKIDLAKYKKPIAIAGIATLIYLFMTSKAFGKITTDNKKRLCDPAPWGCGSFGAGRGDRTHQGLDIKTAVGQQILSPISGTVTRHPYPYNGNLVYTGIEIKNSEYHVKIFYVTPLVAVNKTVAKGQVIAKAQNIAAKYSPSMTNHAHIEVREAKTGKLINPETLF